MGFEALRHARLCSSLEPVVDCRVHARALSVTLAFCDDSGEESSVADAAVIRLVATSSLRGDGPATSGRSLEHHYPVRGKADAARSLAQIVALLDDAGVRRIWVVRQPAPEFRSELRPGLHPGNGSGARHSAAVPEASESEGSVPPSVSRLSRARGRAPDLRIVPAPCLA